MRRRTFLKSSAAIGAASLLPLRNRASAAALPAADPPSDEWMQDAVNEAMSLGASDAVALYLAHRRQSGQVRKDMVYSLNDNEEAGITLRVRFEGMSGSASVPSARRGSPKEFARAAMETTRAAGKLARTLMRKEGTSEHRESLSGAVDPKPVRGSWAPQGIEDPFAADPGERIAFLKELNATALKVTQIPYAVANQFLQKRGSIYVDSRGSRIEQQQYATYVNFAVTAFHQQKRLMDTRTSEREAQSTDWAGATANMQSELETAMQEVLRMQQADQVTPDSYDLVIHPSMLWNLLLETLLPHFDPRQLAERDGRSPGERWLTLAKLKDFSLRSRALRLRWDSTLPGGLATCGWDDAGEPAGSDILCDGDGVINGIPVSPDLVTSDSVYGSGAGFRGFPFSLAAAWNSPATVAMPNLVLEGGPGKNIDDLIAGVDNGLFIKGRGTVVTNPAKTLFRVRPQAAWIIRGGKIAEMVRDVEIETSTEQFWNALVEVGRKEDTFLGGDLFPARAFPLWDTPFSIATPPAHFRNVSVYRAEVRR